MLQQIPFVTVVDAALDRYVARAPLYLGTAALVAAVGTAAVVFLKIDDLQGVVLTLALIAPLHGIVAIGTSRGLEEEPLPVSEIVTRALRRWPELFVCQFVANIIGTMAVFSLLGNDLISALALLPLSIGWGAISLADVAVAIEEPVPANIVRRLQLLGRALKTTLGYAFDLRTFNRMASLAIIQVPAVLLQQVIHSQATLHHFPVSDLLVALWLSCLSDGVLEAIFTSTFQRLRSA